MRKLIAVGADRSTSGGAGGLEHRSQARKKLTS
jgi:hypothetical protein